MTAAISRFTKRHQAEMLFGTLAAATLFALVFCTCNKGSFVSYVTAWITTLSWIVFAIEWTYGMTSYIKSDWKFSAIIGLNAKDALPRSIAFGVLAFSVLGTALMCMYLVMDAAY
jgi:hypothetical protein